VALAQQQPVGRGMPPLAIPAPGGGQLRPAGFESWSSAGRMAAPPRWQARQPGLNPDPHSACRAQPTPGLLLPQAGDADRWPAGLELTGRDPRGLALAGGRWPGIPPHLLAVGAGERRRTGTGAPARMAAWTPASPRSGPSIPELAHGRRWRPWPLSAATGANHQVWRLPDQPKENWWRCWKPPAGGAGTLQPFGGPPCALPAQAANRLGELLLVAGSARGKPGNDQLVLWERAAACSHSRNRKQRARWSLLPQGGS